MTQISDELVEKMAKEMILLGGGQPELPIFKGEPRMFGTPQGPVFQAPIDQPVPMWTLYTGSARKALEMAQGILEDAMGAVSIGGADEQPEAGAA